MKITGIEIGDYRQFKNIKFDFTYPANYHDPKKVGKPLEKVCFIGQSGTGKTTLLRIIWSLITPLQNWEQFHIDQGYLNLAEELNSPTPETLGNVTYVAAFGHKIINFKGKVFLASDTKKEHFSVSLINKLDIDHIAKDYTEKLGIFIADSIAREADAFLFDQKDQPQTFSDFVKTDTQIEKVKATYEERIKTAGAKKVVSLGDMQSISIWQYLLNEINQYDDETVQQITKIVQNTPKNQVADEIQKWIDSNPRIHLAEKCLNPILNKFFLEVDTDGGNIPIALRTKQGVKINSSYLSTGTRQLLSTAIPLYKFDTKDTVILFDEPERSLFPNIQRGLIDYYTSLAPEAQFFFATHSPIIASAFEPCERFILSFNEQGEVEVHSGIAPEGDDPNDILRQDFAMSPLMLDEGVKQYQKYLDLVTQIKNETDTDRKMELIAKRSEIGNKYNFSVTNPDETN